MIRTTALLLCLALSGAMAPGHAQDAPPKAYAYAFSNEGGDDEAGIARLDSFIQQRMRDAGLFADGAGEGRVEVTVTHYYARSDGARAWAGIMAGRDKVASTVRVLDADGAVRETFEVESSNATAFGSTAGLHEKHADEIVARLLELP
ncbi:DUF4410 domain-containing protein [Luteimonas kalidii]|uniref:DUF4410 domain-containing protein n=1 Tax=Luteimonas kalidii TaxID=3042025 RepID=A0ABT6JSB4_9GAMM|nr:DUF4410 domain-containing protein [Luteimonas kalidii]MDH5833492.1 DUF4410 domain-containing protein [Luteimonas kalidii]